MTCCGHGPKPVDPSATITVKLIVEDADHLDAVKELLPYKLERLVSEFEQVEDIEILWIWEVTRIRDQKLRR